MAPDAHFEHPRLVSVYDDLDPDRSDLDAYLVLAEQLGARSVCDVGCGTGVLALLLADRGLDVVGVDPAAGSLAVAAAKPGADRVRWVHGDATALPAVVPPAAVDLVTMTGNAAQAITDPGDWAATLRAARRVLAPGGHPVLETRDPAARAWRGWTRQVTERTPPVEGAGDVTTWVQVTEVDGPLVAFTSTFVFASDGQVLTSRSLLRFRTREEVQADLFAAGFTVLDVRGAPDRPGLELVVVATPTDPPEPGTASLGEHVLGWARAAGYRSIQFNAVVETNHAAVHLWPSLGFTVLTTVPEAFDHPEHGLVGLHVMFQRLDPRTPTPVDGLVDDGFGMLRR